jgi:hypothetical protein
MENFPKWRNFRLEKENSVTKWPQTKPFGKMDRAQSIYSWCFKNVSSVYLYSQVKQIPAVWAYQQSLDE